ncbi:MAG: hypothetical protein H6624_02245 [Bdellovibrionaceae bacterium]|nr:hypothetical protein [Bdellovibrionales bacterium]MCB9083131.1 hypothetical protein [Pseudobdellovibrionaceae bacterium]
MGNDREKKPKRLFDACAKSVKLMEEWQLDQDGDPQNKRDYLSKRRLLWTQLKSKLEELSR